MPKKKPFIDKKNAVSFHLVHRSQRDPLQADEDAPQRVLLAAKPNQVSDTEWKEEQKKYGIFFEDDYNYLQHLKNVDEIYDVQPTEVSRIKPESKAENKKSLVFPSSVFGSEVQTNEGLLNKAAPVSGPQLDWEPDIVEALDDDFDFDDPKNQLDDDFISMALGDESIPLDEEDNASNSRTHDFIKQQRHLLGDGIEGLTLNDARGRELDSGSDIDSDNMNTSDFGDDDDRLGAMPSFSDEETKTRFTDYSMSSSVIKRNEGLTLLDDRFEKLYEQYDDDEIGALDNEEIGGFIQPGSDLLENALSNFDEFVKKTTMKETVEGSTPADAKEDGESDSEESSDDNLVNMEVEPPKEQWDCKSILSTYSNLYNHPSVIKEPRKIKLTKRLNIPAGVLPERGPTNKQVERMTQLDKVPAYRPKDETAEERRERKHLIKDERRMRRIEKKANQNAFKDEKKRQGKESLNVQQAMQGVRLL